MKRINLKELELLGCDYKRGKPKKTVSEEAYRLISPVVAARVEFDREEIIALMMLPMATELARCLEDGIVGTPAASAWRCG